ncbi:MAG: type II toxin-antitoxin system VapC family toxin [Opitutales bacterium]|nr:type II toxin-antitoxin system VapC family toxin [Opitutales bacterium]
MIVVDSNILLYLLIEGDRTGAVVRLQEREPVWVAPRLWLDEFLNVLCTYERLGRTTAAENLRRVELAGEVVARSYFVPPARTLALARRTGCSGYDSQFLALAEDLGVYLYTFDEKVLTSAPDLARCPPAA